MLSVMVHTTMNLRVREECPIISLIDSSTVFFPVGTDTSGTTHYSNSAVISGSTRSSGTGNSSKSTSSVGSTSSGSASGSGGTTNRNSLRTTPVGTPNRAMNNPGSNNAASTVSNPSTTGARTPQPATATNTPNRGTSTPSTPIARSPGSITVTKTVAAFGRTTPVSALNFSTSKTTSTTSTISRPSSIRMAATPSADAGGVGCTPSLESTSVTAIVRSSSSTGDETSTETSTSTIASIDTIANAGSKTPIPAVSTSTKTTPSSTTRTTSVNSQKKKDPNHVPYFLKSKAETSAEKQRVPSTPTSRSLVQTPSTSKTPPISKVVTSAKTPVLKTPAKSSPATNVSPAPLLEVRSPSVGKSLTGKITATSSSPQQDSRISPTRTKQSPIKVRSTSQDQDESIPPIPLVLSGRTADEPLPEESCIEIPPPPPKTPLRNEHRGFSQEQSSPNTLRSPAGFQPYWHSPHQNPRETISSSSILSQQNPAATAPRLSPKNCQDISETEDLDTLSPLSTRELTSSDNDLFVKRAPSFDIFHGLDHYVPDDDQDPSFDQRAAQERFIQSPKKYQKQHVLNYYDKKESYRQVNYPMVSGNVAHPSTPSATTTSTTTSNTSTSPTAASSSSFHNQMAHFRSPSYGQVFSAEVANGSGTTVVTGLVTRTRQTHLVSDPPHFQANQHKTCYAWTAVSMIRQAHRLELHGKKEANTENIQIPEAAKLYNEITDKWFIGNKVKGGDLLGHLQRFIQKNENWQLFELNYQRFRGQFNHSDARFCVFGMTLKFTQKEWELFDEVHHYEPSALPADEQAALKFFLATLSVIEHDVREQQKSTLIISLSEEHKRFMNYLYWKLIDYPSSSVVAAALADPSHVPIEDSPAISSKSSSASGKQQNTTITNPGVSRLNDAPYIMNIRKREEEAASHTLDGKSRSNSGHDLAILQLQEQVKTKFFELLKLFPDQKFPKSTYTITPDIFYQSQEGSNTSEHTGTRSRNLSTAAIIVEEEIETEVSPYAEDGETAEAIAEKEKQYFCHSLAVYGVDLENTTNCVIAKNSWGPTWGFIGGHCRISFEWLKQLANEQRVIFYRLSPKGWTPVEVFEDD